MTLLNFREAKDDLLSPKNNYKARIAMITLGLLLSIAYMLFFIPRSAGADNVKLEVKRLIDLTNAERIKNNLPTLTINTDLNLAAKHKASDIFKWQKFSHDLPGKKFSDEVKKVGYEYAITGENLAEGFADAEAIMKAWMKSQGHRENILNPRYQEIGMSIKRDKLEGRVTYVVVQYFGSRLDPLIILSENFWPSSYKAKHELMIVSS
ncbi:MAG: CAP domain-containing protein [Candidatus Komeilibacteria bacterium]|nr:CAP domain-containing protein [Candidatus Komeilibacteria bacterium]